MLKRTEGGSLRLDALNLSIFFGEMFVKCGNTKEVQWLVDQLIDHVDNTAAEREDELEGRRSNEFYL